MSSYRNEAQLVFTETRFADVFDVLANLTGAVLGAIVIVLWAKFFCTSKI
jgi:glycopeptide antibiotics resistance protein